MRIPTLSSTFITALSAGRVFAAPLNPTNGTLSSVTHALEAPEASDLDFSFLYGPPPDVATSGLKYGLEDHAKDTFLLMRFQRHLFGIVDSAIAILWACTPSEVPVAVLPKCAIGFATNAVKISWSVNALRKWLEDWKSEMHRTGRTSAFLNEIELVAHIFSQKSRFHVGTASSSETRRSITVTAPENQFSIEVSFAKYKPLHSAIEVTLSAHNAWIRKVVCPELDESQQCAVTKALDIFQDRAVQRD